MGAFLHLEKPDLGSGAVAHTCNPNTLWGPRWANHEVRSSRQPSQHSETPSLLKMKQLDRAWWRMPVIPVTPDFNLFKKLSP